MSACGVEGSSSDSSASTGTSPPSGDAGVIGADHPQCQALGEAVLEYLTTGDTGGEPEMERAYADTRASILTQPEEAREGVARARASDAVDACDTRLAEQAAAEAEDWAQAEAQEQADREVEERQRQRQEDADAAAEEERIQLETFRHACAAVGGEADGLSCTVDYPGWPDQYVPMDDSGNLIPEDVEVNRQDCEIGLEDAQISADEGYPWSELPQFHEDSGVCTYGTP